MNYQFILQFISVIYIKRRFLACEETTEVIERGLLENGNCHREKAKHCYVQNENSQTFKFVKQVNPPPKSLEVIETMFTD